MESAVVDRPSICLLVLLRAKDTDNILFRYRLRSVFWTEDVVDVLS